MATTTQKGAAHDPEEIVDDAYRGEETARQWLDDLQTDVLRTLAEADLAPDDRSCLQESRVQMRPAFEELAKIIEPLRASNPRRFKIAFNCLQQLMQSAFFAGAFVVISDSAKAFLKRPNRIGGSAGGQNSAKTRRARAAQNWQAEATKMAISMRTKQPSLPQQKLAQKIWDALNGKVAAGVDQKRPPDVPTIVLFIRRLEKAGTLAPRQR
jgi:hypothetical protein